jgi:hypothetical protein
MIRGSVMTAQPRVQNPNPVGAEVPTGTSGWEGASSRSSEHDRRVGPPQLVEVRCECGDSNCTGEITLSLEEYQEVRVHPRRFVIKEGHEVGAMVRVVGHGTGYVVVARYHEAAFSIGGL